MNWTASWRVNDPALRADLRAHVDRIRAKRTFGLVFESHLPERVRLPEHPIRIGVKVAFRDDTDSAAFQVLRIHHGRATVRKVRHPDGAMLSSDELAEVIDEERDVDTLVVAADFGEPVYPGLRRLGAVARGSDKPAHVVIKGENHHVLEALQFTHAGKVDCIYIDPPYNTGARDWKYDNNYVDDTDAYRHSKWLAFMERRLRLAKDLLNPDNSVLIVTIDEKEYLRLGLLLDQVFPGQRDSDGEQRHQSERDCPHHLLLSNRRVSLLRLRRVSERPESSRWSRDGRSALAIPPENGHRIPTGHRQGRQGAVLPRVRGGLVWADRSDRRRHPTRCSSVLCSS